MELINPLEISGKIMSLIAEAKQFVIIVSPYYNFSRWDKLLRVLEKATSRGIKMTFYVREGEYKSIQELRKFGLEYIEFENLHAKLYLNESTGIISSMNLNMSSDTNSLDIGCQTENEKEYNLVLDFYNKYIKTSDIEDIVKTSANTISFETFVDSLQKELWFLNQDFAYRYLDSTIELFMDNNYYITIEHINGINLLRVSNIITQSELRKLRSMRLFSKENFFLNAGEVKIKNYDSIGGVLMNINSKSLEKIYQSELPIILNAIKDSVYQIREIKRNLYSSFY